MSSSQSELPTPERATTENTSETGPPVLSNAELVAYYRDHIMKEEKTFLDKDGNVKQPSNMFILFRSTYAAMLKDLTKQTGCIHPFNLNTVLGVWRNLSADEKADWEEFQDDESLAHKAAHPNYRYRRQFKKRPVSARGKANGGIFIKAHGSKVVSLGDETALPWIIKQGLASTQSAEHHASEAPAACATPAPGNPIVRPPSDDTRAHGRPFIYYEPIDGSTTYSRRAGNVSCDDADPSISASTERSTVSYGKETLGTARAGYPLRPVTYAPPELTSPPEPLANMYRARAAPSRCVSEETEEVEEVEGEESEEEIDELEESEEEVDELEESEEENMVESEDSERMVESEDSDT